MSRLKEAIQKRTNYAAKFELPFLDREQIDSLNKHLEPLNDEEAPAAREAWIAEHCWLKLIVTRIADAELGRAEEKAREPLLLLPKDRTEQQYQTAALQFFQVRRDEVWPLITRHITKAVERSDGKWADVPLGEVTQYLNFAGLHERSFVVQGYYDLIAKDKKEAQGDPGFLAKDS